MSEQKTKTEKTVLRKKGENAERTLKKITSDIIKLKAGDKVEATYIDRTEGPWLDKKTGVEKMLPRLIFERENSERFIIFEDSGLRQSMLNAGVKPGMFIVLVKKDKTDIGQGRTCNQYDIFVYAD